MENQRKGDTINIHLIILLTFAFLNEVEVFRKFIQYEINFSYIDMTLRFTIFK